MKKDDSNNDEIKKLTFLFIFHKSSKAIEKKPMLLINYSHFII